MGKISDTLKAVNNALSMRESARMERMASMNMERRFYRGASKSNDALTHFTRDKKAAGDFAKRFSDGDVTEYALRTDRMFDATESGSFTPRQADAIREALNANDYGFIANDIHEMIREGHPPAIIYEIINRETGGGAGKVLGDAGYDFIDASQEFITLNRKDSYRDAVNAAFDPAKKDSSSVLAGIGGAALVGGSLLGSDGSQAAINEYQDYERQLIPSKFDLVKDSLRKSLGALNLLGTGIAGFPETLLAEGAD